MYTDLYDIEELKQSPNFGIKSYKDSYYAGEITQVSREREGFGICQYFNSRHYEGFWLTDKRHGKGYERFSNGNVYIGEYE